MPRLASAIDAVVARSAVDDRHRDERVGVECCARQRAKIDVGERVAVDDQEAIGGEQRHGARRAAGRSQHVGLPRVAHVEAEGANRRRRCA